MPTAGWRRIGALRRKAYSLKIRTAWGVGCRGGGRLRQFAEKTSQLPLGLFPYDSVRLIQCIDHEPTVRFPQEIRGIGVEAQVIWGSSLFSMGAFWMDFSLEPKAEEVTANEFLQQAKLWNNLPPDRLQRKSRGAW